MPTATFLIAAALTVAGFRAGFRAGRAAARRAADEWTIDEFPLR